MRRDGIAPLRMRTQRLWGPRCDTPRDVVRWLGALQAQEFPMAKWSVAQRTRGATRADVEQAFADGVIVRTHVLRLTWHFALAEDIRWLLRHCAAGERLERLLQQAARARQEGLHEVQHAHRESLGGWITPDPTRVGGGSQAAAAFARAVPDSPTS